MAQKVKYLHGQKGKNIVIFLHPTLSVYNDLHWAHLFLWLDVSEQATSYLTLLTRIPLLAY